MGKFELLIQNSSQYQDYFLSDLTTKRIPPLTCRRSLSAILMSELCVRINTLAMRSDRKCSRAGGRELGVTIMVSERLCSRDFLFVL